MKTPLPLDETQSPDSVYNAWCLKEGRDRAEQARRQRARRNLWLGPHCDHFLTSSDPETPRRLCSNRAEYFSNYNKLDPSEEYYHCKTCVAGPGPDRYSTGARPLWRRFRPHRPFRPGSRLRLQLRRLK